MSRPTKYTDSLAKLICKKLATTSISLRKLCEQNNELPCASTVFDWLTKKPKFLEQYQRARVAQTHVLIDESLEIADDADNDILESETEYGTSKTSNSAAVQRADLRIKTRMHLAKILNKKNYSEQTIIKYSATDERQAINEILQQLSNGLITAEDAQKAIAVQQASLDSKVKHEVADYIAEERAKEAKK
jgi:hypothetical protein